MKANLKVHEDHFDNSMDSHMTVEHRKHAHRRPCPMRKVYTHKLTGRRYIKPSDPIVSQWEGDNFNLKKILKGKAFQFIKKIANPLNSLKLLAATAKFSVLVPFLPLMKNALKRKGLNPPSGIKNIPKLAQMFFENIVKKHTSNYDDIDSENLEDNLLPLAIIPPIIGFVKQIIAKAKANKAKIAAGEKPDPMPPAIADMAQDAVTAEKTLITKAQAAGVPLDDSGAPTGSAGPAKDEPKSMGGIPKMVWIGGGVIVALIIAVMLFKK